MKVRSLAEFDGFLDQQLARRKKELVTLRLTLVGRREDELTSLMRASLCMLYAHWEGFVKSAGTAYVKFVARQGLKYRDLQPGFVALGLRSELTQAGQTNRGTIRTEIVERFLTGLGERAQIDWRNSIDTRSNLNSDTLWDILATLGLDSRGYLLESQRLDSRLVAKRNGIAHGELIEIDIEEYVELHELVLRLVERFREDVGNAAEMKNYRRKRWELQVAEGEGRSE